MRSLRILPLLQVHYVFRKTTFWFQRMPTVVIFTGNRII